MKFTEEEMENVNKVATIFFEGMISNTSKEILKHVILYGFDIKEYMKNIEELEK